MVCRAGFTAILLSAMVAGSFAQSLIATYDEWPGTYGTISGYDGKLFKYWLPDTARSIRGIYVTEAYDSLGHDETCALGPMRYAFVLFAGDPSRNYGDNTLKQPTAQQLLDFIKAVAQKTGHGELVNCPMVWNGQFDNAWISSAFPGRVICQRRWGGGTVDCPMFEAREEQSYGKPTVAFTARPQYTWSVMWGWTHGWYSARDLWWTWVTEIVKLRVPKTWNPSSGQPKLLDIPQDSVWLGDPASVYGDWPKIASYNQYSGSKSGAVWLPNAYTAYVWRAFSSRHPTETMGQQGEGITGSVASTYGLSGQPNFMVTGPSRPYNHKKPGGKGYVVYKVGDSPVVKGIEFGVAKYGKAIQKVEFYDGNRKLGEVPYSAYGLYSISKPSYGPWAGTHSILAIVTVQSGSGTRQFTSRPATMYVTDIGMSTDAVVRDPIALTPRTPERARQVYWNIGTGVRHSFGNSALPLDFAGRVVPLSTQSAGSTVVLTGRDLQR